MGFKLSDLKDWQVKRDVTLKDGMKLQIEIAIKKRSEFEKIVQGGNDLSTAKTLITNVTGLDDEKGKPMTINAFWKAVEDYPAIIMKLAAEAVDAQYQAALKN